MAKRVSIVSALLLLTYVTATFSQLSYRTISGSVKTAAGAAISGVAMNGFPAPTTTDGLGNYSTSVPVYVGGSTIIGWSGTVIPTKTGYIFVPDSTVYTNVTTNHTNQNYTGALQTFTISGYVKTTGGAAISGVAMTGLPVASNTDASGFYSCVVSYGWSGTVTPSKAGYSFSPASIPYSTVAADQSNQNYTGTVLTFTISGSVKTAGGAAISGVAMTGLPVTTGTDGSGFYSCVVSYGWSGGVTPTKAGYSFSPASIPYSTVAGNQTNQNYTGTVLTFTISGNVKTAGGAAISSVAMTGLPVTTSTDASGFYSCAVSYGWSGTVTPTKAGYGFSPGSTSYSSVTSDQTNQNYSGAQQTFTISGYVKNTAGAAIGGVAMTGLPVTTNTDASGLYSCVVSYGWSGTVTPTKGGYNFSPTSIAYSAVESDQVSQDYSGTLQRYTISGYVKTAGGAAVSGVAMTGMPVVTNTDVSGFYSCTVGYGWSGSVTPTKAGYSFSATSIAYGAVTFDQMNQNYTATALTGLQENPGPSPTSYELKQNYPNPFNPSTTIGYALPKSALVSLRVFNALGQEVASLVNKQEEAGQFHVVWIANVPSGIYVYRLKAGEFVMTKKMLLLK